MGRREAEEERQKAAGLVQQAYSGGYEHPIEVGGVVFTPIVLSPYAAGTAAAATSSGQARGRARPTGSLLMRRWVLRWRRRHLGLCRRRRRRQ